MDRRRFVPRTDSVLADPRLAEAATRLGRARVKAAVTEAQRKARIGLIGPGDVADDAAAALPPRATTLTPVLNATGVLLHTNLGRAPLSAAAREAMLTAAGCTDLEFDLATGARGKRGAGLSAALAAAVPAAQAVHVVNNNAAALVLAATALTAPGQEAAATGREVVISRGELIEIGDRFRLPELIESTGARIREVGTTNRTTFADYASAIGPATAFVLKVHPSNYRIEGFTSAVTVAELASLPVTVVGDIGSGLLTRHPALPGEPDADSWLRAGAALVTASGDKLLGGPQAGLILGRADLVRAMARHPLARALRVGKLTIAALEAALSGPPVPVAGWLAVDPAALTARAGRLAKRLSEAGVDARSVPSEAAVGGGGAPGTTLASAAVSLPGSFAVPLRAGEAVRRGEIPAVVGRADGSRVQLDLRAVAPEDDDALARAVLAAAAAVRREDVPETAGRGAQTGSGGPAAAAAPPAAPGSPAGPEASAAGPGTVTAAGPAGTGEARTRGQDRTPAGLVGPDR